MAHLKNMTVNELIISQILNSVKEFEKDGDSLDSE